MRQDFEWSSFVKMKSCQTHVMNLLMISLIDIMTGAEGDRGQTRTHTSREVTLVANLIYEA